MELSSEDWAIIAIALILWIGLGVVVYYHLPPLVSKCMPWVVVCMIFAIVKGE